MEEPREQQFQSGDQKQTLGFGAKLINIFTSPTKTFEALDHNPTWLVPLLIMILVSLASVYLTFPQLVNIAVENMTKQGEITPDQLEMAMKFVPVSIYGMSVLWPIIWFFLFSAVYYLIGSVFMGGNSTYKKILSVQAWSSLILVLSSIISTPLVMIKNSVYVSLSPSILLSSEHIGTKLFTFMSQFNFFVIWYLIVFGLGFSYVYKFSKAKAFTTMGILYCIWIALSVVFGGASG